jgi:hypothetical protein
MRTSATVEDSAELRTRELARDILPTAISCATVLVARHRAYSYRAAVLHRVYVFNHLWKLSSFGTMIRLDPNTCLFACLSCNLERDGLTICFLEVHETQSASRYQAVSSSITRRIISLAGGSEPCRLAASVVSKGY